MKNNMGLGIFVILFAIVYLLNALGHNVGFDFFGLLVAILALNTLIKSLCKRRIYGTVIGMAMLFYAVMRLLELPSVGFWTLLVFSVILSFGLSLIFNKQKNVVLFNIDNHKQSRKNTNDYCENDNFVDITTTFGEVKRYISSYDLKTCNVDCTFGEVDLYFDNAYIKESAVANITCTFGEVTLYIPKEWNVVSDVMVTFGEQYIQKNDLGKKVFSIKGTLTFGEIKVFYI